MSPYGWCMVVACTRWNHLYVSSWAA